MRALNAHKPLEGPFARRAVIAGAGGHREHRASRVLHQSGCKSARGKHGGNGTHRLAYVLTAHNSGSISVCGRSNTQYSYD